MGSKQAKIVIVAVVVIAAVFGLSVASNRSKPVEKQQPAKTTQSQPAPQAEISYKGEQGKNALELLKQTHKVETKSYEGLGELVTSIDGRLADSKHFWAFYLNGQQSQVGASSYVTQPDDTIAWKLEEIK